MTDVYHIPALLTESLDGLDIRPDGTYVDVTFGGGGHSRAILERLGENGRLIAFDQDEDAFRNIIDDPRFILVKSNFRFLKNFLRFLDVDEVDGILADLGVSFYHFDEVSRGFSFRADGQLDMRMNSQSTITAAHILNTYQEQELANIFFLYGELKNARKIAQAVVRARGQKEIVSISDFLEIMKPFTPREKENKVLALAFQALRIEVNDELKALEEMLTQGLEMLAEGGRFCVISYHSLEDRLVKNFFRAGNFDGKAEKDFYGNVDTPFDLVNRKVIVASEEEQEANPRSRSAKLRIAEKK